MAAMRRRARLEVPSAAGIRRGVTLQVDAGENAEYVGVLGVSGTSLKVGRIRWWHRLLWSVQELPRHARRWGRRASWRLKEWLCGLSGHRIEGNAACCWCAAQWRHDGYDPEEHE
jgi:hypothetical protein